MLNKTTAGRIFQFNMESDHDAPMRYKNILLYQIGELRYEQGVDDVHQQRCYELSVILAGSGEFSLNGKTIPVKKNDIILTPKQGTHTVTSSDNKFRFLYLGFDFAPDCEFEYLSVLQMYLQSLRTNQCSSDHYGVGGVLKNMLAEFNQQLPYSFEYLSNCLENIMILTWRTFSQHNLRTEPGADAPNPRVVGTTVYTLIKYIEDHIFSIPDIRTLAQEMHFSYTYISHVFKQKTGMTLQRYILQVKIDKSKELILDDRWTLSEIANMLNYESLQSFSKAFKKEVGMSPSEFKRRGLAADAVPALDLEAE